MRRARSPSADSASVNIQAPQFDAPSLAALANVTFPTAALTGSLQSLNASLPTLDELRGTLQAFVAQPFDSVKASINGTLGNFTVDQSVRRAMQTRLIAQLLPVPQRASVDLCSSIDTSFLEDVVADIRKGLVIGLVLLLVFALLLIGALLLIERRSYRSRKRFIEEYRGEWAHAVPSVVALFAFIDATHQPWLHRLVRRFIRDPARRTRVTWATLYATQPTALAFLALGLLTLLLVELQFAFLGIIRARGISSVDGALTDASSAIVGALGGSMNTTSADFAAQSNAHIQSLADGINADLVRRPRAYAADSTVRSRQHDRRHAQRDDQSLLRRRRPGRQRHVWQHAPRRRLARADQLPDRAQGRRHQQRPHLHQRVRQRSSWPR